MELHPPKALREGGGGIAPDVSPFLIRRPAMYSDPLKTPHMSQKHEKQEDENIIDFGSSTPRRLFCSTHVLTDANIFAI